MSKNKISFILHKFNKALLFQINEQHLSEKYNGTTIFVFKKGKYLIKIKRCSIPALHKFPNAIEIWLRGDLIHHNNKICKLNLKSNEERDEVYTAIIETFKKLENNPIVPLHRRVSTARWR